MSNEHHDLLLSRLEAVRDKLTTAERRWLDDLKTRWRDRARRITGKEWLRVETLTDQARER